MAKLGTKNCQTKYKLRIDLIRKERKKKLKVFLLQRNYQIHMEVESCNSRERDHF